MTSANLHKKHQEHLLSFGIPADMLIEAGIRSISDFDVRTSFGFSALAPGCDLSGICFPYFDPQSKAKSRIGARIRLDTPLPDGSKYLSEPGNRRLYIPWGGGDFFGDIKIPIMFVESEKAALALVALVRRSKQRFLPIALGGCWGWRKKRGKKLLPDGSTEAETGPALDLDLIVWAGGRRVLIAFDSNTATRKAVRTARKKLFKELVKRGAQIAFIDIPALEQVNGPDDFIKVAGDNAMLAAIDQALPPLDRGTAPTITVLTGQHPEATDQAEEILIKHARRERIFQRAGEIVRVIRLPKPRCSGGLNRPTGTLMLEPMRSPALMEMLERFMIFEKLGEAGERVRINCPTRIAIAYLSRRGSWHLDTLTGIIAAPLMRLDGTMLTYPGFDQETGLFLESDCKWNIGVEQPTREDAKAALEILRQPFAQFPFVDAEDRAVLISAVATALERRLLEACPLFGFSAPAARSGKTLLAESVAIIATGKAPASAVSTDKEEFRKSLTSVLREGQLVINLDNIEHPLNSADLCKIITQEEFSDRLLGESTNLRLPTNVLWTATGNNLNFRGDLATRALLCRIDAKLERPEQRRFQIENLKAHLTEHREHLVAAILRILRAFHIAGCPSQGVEPWGGFDHWSKFIREPLIWAGEADPCKTREAVLANDPEKDSTYDALIQLYECFGGDHFTVGEVAARANAYNFEYLHQKLHDSLAAVTNSKNNIDGNRLGQWFRQCRGRIVGGLKLQRANSESTKPAKWKVTPT